MEFISQDEVWDSVGSIFAIILGVVLVGILFSAVIPALIDRHHHGKAPAGKQRYGLRGGTICPKCKRPFSIHIWGLNILVGKFDRCPHCGKWSVIRRIPLEDLRGAERAGQTSKVASVPPMQLSEQDKPVPWEVPQPHPLNTERVIPLFGRAPEDLPPQA